MYRTKVLLNSLDKVKTFINIISKYENINMDICCGRYIVDAKSIMGILSMSLISPLELRIYADGTELETIKKEIEKYTNEAQIKYDPSVVAIAHS